MTIVKWPIPIIGKLADNRCTSSSVACCYIVLVIYADILL